MRRQIAKLRNLFCGVIAFLCALPAYCAWTLNMPRGVTPISKDIYELHMAVFWICVGIGVVVFGVLIYALIKHRKSKGAKPADFHENTKVEMLWAIIPFAILVAMAIPATKVLMAMEDTGKSDITIKVTGYQWKWKYDYLDQGISFFSNLSTPYAQMQNKQKKGEHYLYEVDRPLVIPVHKKVRFLVTSNDVIHSWWVPDFGVKRDAIPGFVHEAWAKVDREGVYRGQCAELCGVNHGFMPIVVKVVSEKAFEAWVNKQRAEENKPALSELKPLAVEQNQIQTNNQAASNGNSQTAMKSTAESKPKAEAKKWTKDELMAEGKKVYDKYCVACHQANGEGMPPTFPALKASSVAVGKPISRHIDMILNGVNGTAMQAFADQLTDAEIAAVVTYERNAWSNNTGDVVMPGAVQQRREES